VTVDVPVLGKREADEMLGFGLPPVPPLRRRQRRREAERRGGLVQRHRRGDAPGQRLRPATFGGGRGRAGGPHGEAVRGGVDYQRPERARGRGAGGWGSSGSGRRSSSGAAALLRRRRRRRRRRGRRRRWCAAAAGLMRRRGQGVERHHEEEARGEREPGQPLGHRVRVRPVGAIVVVALVALVALMSVPVVLLGDHGSDDRDLPLDGGEEVEALRDDDGERGRDEEAGAEGLDDVEVGNRGRRRLCRGP